MTLALQLGDFFIDLFVALSLFAIFVTIFFFTIAANVEVMAVQNNTSRVITELFADVKELLSQEQQAELSAHLQTLTAPDLSAEDKEVADQNGKLIEQAAIGVTIFFFVSVAIVTCIYLGFRFLASEYPDMVKLLRDNLVLLFWVAVTEVGFLLLIGWHYRSVDSNAVRKSAVDAVLAYIDG